MRTLNLPCASRSADHLNAVHCSQSALVVIEGSGTVVPLVAISSDVNSDEPPTGVTNGATKDVRLTGVGNGAIGTARRLA